MELGAALRRRPPRGARRPPAAGRSLAPPPRIAGPRRGPCPAAARAADPHDPGRGRSAAARDVAVDRAARPEPRQPDPESAELLRAELSRSRPRADQHSRGSAGAGAARRSPRRQQPERRVSGSADGGPASRRPRPPHGLRRDHAARSAGPPPIATAGRAAAACRQGHVRRRRRADLDRSVEASVGAADGAARSRSEHDFEPAADGDRRRSACQSSTVGSRSSSTVDVARSAANVERAPAAPSPVARGHPGARSTTAAGLRRAS